MPKFTKTITVEAEQVLFADADKEVAKKGLPVTSHGDHLRHEHGIFSVLVHLGDDAKRASEGDWIVVENGKKTILSDEQFKKVYTPLEEVAQEPETILETESKEGISGDQRSAEAKETEHQLTEEGLNQNPELSDAGLKPGDTLGIPAPSENHTETTPVE